MAHPTHSNQHQTPRRPKRVPPERAQGLDPEITAQPRPLSDQLGAGSDIDVGLSVDPDELGSRFLSQATEQGYSDPGRALDVELALSGDPASDEALRGPNFEPNNTQWEQTVDLETRSGGAADQLRAAAWVNEVDSLDEAEDADNEDERDEPMQAAPSAREQKSLLDYEAEEGDEVRTRELPVEDNGRHARVTPRGEHGAQVDLESAINESGVRRVAPELQALEPAPEPAADGGKKRSLRRGATGWAANTLRRLAHWLERIPNQLN